MRGPTHLLIGAALPLPLLPIFRLAAVPAVVASVLGAAGPDEDIRVLLVPNWLAPRVSRARYHNGRRWFWLVTIWHRREFHSLLAGVLAGGLVGIGVHFLPAPASSWPLGLAAGLSAAWLLRRPVLRLAGRRHWLLALTLVSGAIGFDAYYALGPESALWAGGGVTLGWWSHLAADLVNRSGMWLFWPLRTVIRLPHWMTVAEDSLPGRLVEGVVWLAGVAAIGLLGLVLVPR